MTPENFCYWLQGYSEISGDAPTREQWRMIQEHLQLVFQKETPNPEARKLIEEVKARIQSQLDWDKIPEQYNYVAQDDDGAWYCYDEKPIFDGYEWDREWGDADYLDEFQAPPKQESEPCLTLVERPIEFPNHQNDINNQIDWNNIPEGFQWAAMDTGGDWYLHKEKPYFDGDDWQSYYLTMEPVKEPIIDIDPASSLVKRPEE